MGFITCTWCSVQGVHRDERNVYAFLSFFPSCSEDGVIVICSKKGDQSKVLEG